MEVAQANSSTYHAPPLYDQVNVIASAAFKIQQNPENGVASFSNVILGEVIQYVGTKLKTIYKKYETKQHTIKS